MQKLNKESFKESLGCYSMTLPSVYHLYFSKSYIKTIILQRPARLASCTLLRAQEVEVPIMAGLEASDKLQKRHKKTK